MTTAALVYGPEALARVAQAWENNHARLRGRLLALAVTALEPR